MKKLLSERAATFCLLLILALLVVMHLLILAGIIPFALVWGGRLQNQAQMLRFETVSVLVNMLLLAVVALRAGLLRVRLHPIAGRILLGLMAGLFLLNTVGNLLSAHPFEQMVFTPLTLVLFLLSLRLAWYAPGNNSFPANPL
ncbi:hypothetical protein [Hymenobacter sp. DG25B]|uniref:hypothetical protein n=1 Tax=Hymenobacter sp. DG25B TaxID=1385664 RepID=UPI0005CAC0B4|nr:hypothetical protein [Hymenobacter sp. DG25B]